MNTHQALARALELRDLAGDSPAWSMIRSPLAPVIAAVLNAAFPRQNESVPGPELLEMLEPLLDDLRLEGFELLQAAPGYLNDWVKAGYLVRRSPHGTRDEIYELSTAAITALTYLDQIRNPRRSVTRSRLSTITERISQLAIDSDPDEAVVIERLEREAAAITERIGRIRERGVDIISDTEAVERVADILDLVADVPGDFARVRSDIEALDRDLRERILLDDLSAGDVLDNVFRGVDLISDSESGRAFNGFYQLLFDRQRSSLFDAALDTILDRSFMSQLSLEQRSELRWLVKNLENSSDDVHQSMTGLSRSLRRFVQSREAESQQALARSINEAQQLALQVGKLLNPSRSIGVDMELTSRSPASVSTWHLHNPADYRITEELRTSPPVEIDLVELERRFRASEIDLDELRRNVNATLEVVVRPSIGDVLHHRPATQGLASVVGLLKLALQDGKRADGTEVVVWPADPGRLQARLARHIFTRPFDVSPPRVLITADHGGSND